MPDKKEEKTWVERWFGTGVFFSALTAVVGFVGIFQAHSDSSAAVSQVLEQQKLRDEMKEQLQLASTALQELKDRVVKLETAQAVTKVEAQGAQIQAKVAQLMTDYNKPQERQLLDSFSKQLVTRQRSWAEMVQALPTDAGNTSTTPAPSTLPIAPTLPSGMDFLKQSDKSSLESMLDKTQKTWLPPATAPTLPTFDLEKYGTPLLTVEKSLPQQAWDTVKAYPAVIVLLVLFVVGSIWKS
jgi:hypothetical protein